MIAESRNPPGEPIDELGALTCINVMGPQRPIRVVAGAPVEGPDHARMGPRHDGPFLPTPGGQPLG
jgi:hypothetical protein